MYVYIYKHTHTHTHTHKAGMTKISWSYLDFRFPLHITDSQKLKTSCLMKGQTMHAIGRIGINHYCRNVGVIVLSKYTGNKLANLKI